VTQSLAKYVYDYGGDGDGDGDGDGEDTGAYSRTRAGIPTGWLRLGTVTLIHLPLPHTL